MERKRNVGRCTIWLLLIIIVAPHHLPAEPPSELEMLSAFENTITSIADRSLPAIVSIDAIKEMPGHDHDHAMPSASSGFIFHEDGYILTNEHVVHEAKDIRITLSNGAILDPKLIGADPNTDIAVLKIEGEEKFPSLSIADTSKVRIGQFAIAIGHPMGYNYTVTSGIVSGKDRCFHTHTKLFEYHNNYIQTNAWINPGSSGGPLLDIQGKVIGVTTLNPGEGITLAINSSLAKSIAHQLIAHGRMIRGYIDADIQDDSQGMKIMDIKPDSLAFQGGLRRNDVITEFDEKEWLRTFEFRLMVADCQIGASYPVKVMRQGQEVTLNVTIGEMPPELTSHSVDTASVSWQKLGLVTRNLEPNNHERYSYLTAKDRGVIVEKVRQGSPVSNLGILSGTLITAVNGHKIDNNETLNTYLESNSDESSMVLKVKNTSGIKKVQIDVKT